MCTKVYALMLMLFAVVSVYGQDNVIDEVVWVVGDEAILKSDVENERLNAQYEGRKFDGDPYCIIPEQLAIQKLFLHQAAIDSIEVSEQEIISDVERRTNWLIDQIGSKEKVEEYYNKTSTQIREMLRENIRDGKTVQKMQQQIVGDIKITPAEVRRYFKDLPQDSIPFIPTQVEVQIITMEPKIPQEEIERVKKTLRDYTERVTSGEIAFSTLARLYSEDEGSRRRGGELGFMGRAELVPEYANVAFNLQDPNKVSKIVESEFGFHIIQLIEKRGDRINCRHILLKPKISETELNAAMAKMDTLYNDLKEEKFTFDEAATFLSADKDTRNNKGLMVNQDYESSNMGTPKFEMQELPQEIGKVVYDMEVGEISKPFTMLTNKQKEVVAIVKLKARVEGHKANISDDYQALKTIVESRKKEELLNNWIKEKQKTTFVRISEGWQNCDFKYPGWIKE